MKIALLVFSFLFLSLMSYSQTNKKVLLIGIDGCQSDALQEANTPNIDELIANGIYSPDAMNIDVTSSGPGWSAILTGVWSDKHLVNSNNFDGNNYDEYPPLMKYVNEYSEDMHTVSIVHWGPINDEIIQGNADFVFTFNSDEAVSNTAASYLTLNDPDFTFIHFDDVDHAGHESGFTPSNPNYIAAIEIIDDLIQPILEAIENRPTYETEDWLILVTTDHGGNGNSHGGGSFGERNIFMIASGDAIDQEVILADSSITTVENCLGENVELTFDGNDDFIEIPENELFNFGIDQDFTIECRIRTSEAADVAIVGNKDWDTGYNPGFVFSFSGGTWKVNIGDDNDREDINGGVVSDNVWHTLSVTFDRDGDMKMYEDGVFLSSTNISTIGNINSGEGLFFGADVFSNYDYFGAIAEVRVWNDVLEETTINNWLCDSLDGSHPNYDDLIGYWKLNDQDGLAVIDYSSFGNDGLINGATWDLVEEIIVYDYSYTPRSVDASVTALTHLCIPIENSWDLDGNSLIPLCSPTGVTEQNKGIAFDLFPTISDDEIKLFLSQEWMLSPAIVVIYSTLGEIVYRDNVTENQINIDVSDLASGQYLVAISNSKTNKSKLFIKE